MITLPELEATGRAYRDLSGSMLEYRGGTGDLWQVLTFEEVYRTNSALTTGVQLVRSFLEHPMVPGLAELRKLDSSACAFAYPTGQVWTLHELIRAYDRIGSAAGPRAAAELCVLGGAILVEAAENGPVQGCFSHGNINPWRLLVDAHGHVVIIGYGLPQVELHDDSGDVSTATSADSLRYAPPERLDGDPEDDASDLWSLALVAAELATGKPVLDGTPAQVRRMISHGEVQSLVADLSMPTSLTNLLTGMVAFDPNTRLTGQEFEALARDVLEDVEGRNLQECASTLVRTVDGAGRRKAKMTVDDEIPKVTPATPAAEDEASAAADSRWTKVEEPKRRRRKRKDDEPKKKTRSRRRGDTSTEETSPKPSTSRRRRRKKEDDPPAASPNRDAEASEPAEPPAEPRRTRRSRSKTEDSEEAAAPTRRTRRRSSAATESDAAADEPENEPPPTRRSRRRGSSTASTDAEAPEETKAPEVAEDDAPSVRRTKRRSSTSETNSETTEEPAAPTRRTRRRSTASEPEAEAEAEAPSENTPQEDTPAEEPPAPPTRRTRRRASAAPAEPAEADNEAPEESPPKPRRRRRRRS